MEKLYGIRNGCDADRYQPFISHAVSVSAMNADAYAV